MQLSYAELEEFFESIVTRARQEGVICAITSGMACVHFQLAQGTKDCDALCAPETADRFLAVVNRTHLDGAAPSYRGNLSPPLDARWHRGGWTSHFFWKSGDRDAQLDVFGVAPRGSTPWMAELEGLYASRHTVAEMKRTDRAKDWPFVTALGGMLLEARDQRGWLHLCDADVLLGAVSEKSIPDELVQRRPILRLALERDSRLGPALHAEIQFWHQLDYVRIRVYQHAVRPYMVAVRKAQIPDGTPLIRQHEVRLQCAEAHLPRNPIAAYGLDRLIDEARERTKLFANPDYMQWLPDVREHFISLVS